MEKITFEYLFKPLPFSFERKNAQLPNKTIVRKIL